MPAQPLTTQTTHVPLLADQMLGGPIDEDAEMTPVSTTETVGIFILLIAIEVLLYRLSPTLFFVALSVGAWITLRFAHSYLRFRKQDHRKPSLPR